MILGAQKYDPLRGRRRVNEKACNGADRKKGQARFVRRG
jgi:hypothetical protein